MNTMKAVRLFEFGGPDKLRYGDHSMPDVGPTDVLVKVLATSVSRWDVKYRSGEVHEFYDELGKTYHRVDGYSLKAKLKEARERAGTATP